MQGLKMRRKKNQIKKPNNSEKLSDNWLLQCYIEYQLSIETTDWRIDTSARDMSNVVVIRVAKLYRVKKPLNSVPS